MKGHGKNHLGRRYPIGLSDGQLAMVMDVAATLPQQLRHSLLLRIASRLQLSGNPELRTVVNHEQLARAVTNALRDVMGDSG